MVITQTPFRMSFFGGGTDFPDFYREHGGAVISTTFDKYCYVNVRHLPRFFDYTNELIYSKIERVGHRADIQHPAIRNAMEMMDMHELRLTYETEGQPAPADLRLPAGFTDHYVPDGFVLDEENSLELDDVLFRGYYNPQGGENYAISCYVICESGQVSTYDNEHTVYEMIDLNGTEAILGTSTNVDGTVSYYLIWDKNGIHCSINGNMDLEQFLLVAESIY